MVTDSDQEVGVDSQVDSSSSREKAIEIRNLLKTFSNGSIVAIDEIDLTIDADEFVVLVGPSGCGKTTTLRSICGLEQPDSGSILLNGREITNESPKARNLAFVFQDIALFPHMTVRENIRFGLDMASDLSGDEKEERVREAAELLGIGDMLDRKPSELSGGQQQRVSIGRAMVTEPVAFLLDEPFSALDANLRDRMRTEVKQLQRQLETAMIFVTHDQEEAMTLGDKIVVMNNGKIMQHGTPYEIYNEPTNRFIAEFIGSPTTNFFECAVEPTDGNITLESEFFTTTLKDAPNSISGGQTVTLGVRPENLKMDSINPLFQASIDVIEPHGTNDAIYMTVNGPGGENHEVVGLSAQNRIKHADDPLSVGFEEDNIWLFDQDGERID